MRAIRNFLTRHWLFGIALAIGLAMRVITMLGFPPAIWYGGDSVSYLNSALSLEPGTSRESGYGIMLAMLRPFRNFAVVTGLQHLMGLAIAVMIYALLRHRYRLPAWGATLAALPVLLDAYAIQLEQEVLADEAFAFLCALALTLVLWWPDDKRPAWSLPAAALLLGVASAFWPVGLPLLIVLLVYMIVRRFGWQALVATALAGAVPLVAYLAWFDGRYHKVAFNESAGIFLWSRTMTFADCSIIKPPADLRPLCPTGKPGQRPEAPFYIWNNSPLYKIGKPGTREFDAYRNGMAQKFAIKAIEAQPLSYADTVLHSWLLTFTWNRANIPSAKMASRYQFTNATQTWADSGTPTAAGLARVQRKYTGGHTAATRMVQPFADIMIDYQRFVYLRGTLVGIMMLIGLGGIVRSWRNGGFRKLRGWGGPALFPWLAALTMEVVPPATADYSLRYVVPGIPAACLAAALAFARPLTSAVTEPAAAEPVTAAGDFPAGDSTSGAHASNGHPAYSRMTDSHPTDSRMTDGPTDSHTVDSEPSSSPTASSHPADSDTHDGQPADSHPANRDTSDSRRGR